METEKIICDCGAKYTRKNSKRHDKTVRHQYFVLKQRENELINSHYKEWLPEIFEPLVYEYNPLTTDIKE
jgi:hypothetical protein